MRETMMTRVRTTNKMTAKEVKASFPQLILDPGPRAQFLVKLRKLLQRSRKAKAEEYPAGLTMVRVAMMEVQSPRMTMVVFHPSLTNLKEVTLMGAKAATMAATMMEILKIST